MNQEEKNLTREVFAEIIGVSRDLIAKIETGKRKITSNVFKYLYHKETMFERISR